MQKLEPRVVENFESYSQRLRSIVPRFEIKNMAEALDISVLTFCSQSLAQGMTTKEILKHLGIGAKSQFWVAIRREIMKQTLPENEDEALLLFYEHQEEVIDRLEELLLVVDEKIAESPRTEEEVKAYHYYIKYKLEIIKSLAQARESRFSQYLNMKHLTLSKKHGRAGGVNILIQNMIPRPPQEIEIKELNVGNRTNK